MQKIWEIVGSCLNKYDVTESAFALVVMGRTRKYLVDIYWDVILKSVVVDKYFRFNVYIKCEDSTLAQDIFLNRMDIIDGLQRDFPWKFIGIKVVS